MRIIMKIYAVFHKMDLITHGIHRDHPPVLKLNQGIYKLFIYQLWLTLTASRSAVLVFGVIFSGSLKTVHMTASLHLGVVKLPSYL